MNSIKKQLSLLPLGKTIIPVSATNGFLDKVRFLCKSIPREEWSGVLFYETTGTIKDLKSFKVKLTDIYLMDKGSSVFTSYELDEELIGYRMKHPETLTQQIGHIHSHNVMKTFFSLTDEAELVDNAPHHNYYLSVITNNWLDFTVRIAFVSATTGFTSVDEDGEIYTLPETELQELVYYYNCKVNLPKVEISVPDDFKDNFGRIIEKAKEKKEKEKKENKRAIQQMQTEMFQVDDDPTHAQLYHREISEFLIDLLSQNAPVKLEAMTLKTALVQLMKNLGDAEDEDVSEYCASTINDYTTLYFMNFEEDSENEDAFMEDLNYCINLLKDGAKTFPNVHGILVLDRLISLFNKFAESYQSLQDEG